MPSPPFTDPWLPPLPVPLVRPAVPVAVYRLTGAVGAVAYQALPNVVCLAIEEHEGPAPASALFRYRFDGRDANGPQSLEQALSTAFTGPDVVNPGDRLAVRAWRPDGTPVWVFDGFCYTFSGELGESTEEVRIAAVGTAKRAWDTPISGQTVRHSNSPETPGSDLDSDLVARFNLPNRDGARGNASPSTGDSGTATQGYPVFMDPDVSGTDSDGVDYPRAWTLPMAVAWATYKHGDENYVATPDRSVLDALLVSRKPIDGAPFDPNNPATYTASDITVSDAPRTGKNWPNVVRELTVDSGFGMRFYLAPNSAGEPQTKLGLFLYQAAPAKPLLLQARGAALDPAWTNLSGASLARDLSGVVNRWVVRGGLDRFEASFVLAPVFPSQATDSTGGAAALANYDVTSANFDATYFNAYRTWVFDETGEGHYANASTTKLTAVPSLDGVLGSGNYVVKRRAPIGKLFSVDDLKNPRAFRLAISTDYNPANGYPAVWDGTGTWQPVQGGVELLKDRIGVRITAPNANAWNIYESKDAGHPFPSGKVPAVECISNPSAPNNHPAFYLRLTCVIESDVGLAAVADVSPSTPIRGFPITREVDARDRYYRGWVHGKSEFNATAADVQVHDDTLPATAEGVALRTATEAGAFEGEVEIPRFTAYYEIGDRISDVTGRGLPLRTDNGGTGYAPVLPVVIARRWELDGGQRTVLKLSDQGLDRKRYAARRMPYVHAPARKPAPAPAGVAPGLPGGAPAAGVPSSDSDPSLSGAF